MSSYSNTRYLCHCARRYNRNLQIREPLPGFPVKSDALATPAYGNQQIGKLGCFPTKPSIFCAQPSSYSIFIFCTQLPASTFNLHLLHWISITLKFYLLRLTSIFCAQDLFSALNLQLLHLTSIFCAWNLPLSLQSRSYLYHQAPPFQVYQAFKSVRFSLLNPFISKSYHSFSHHLLSIFPTTTTNCNKLPTSKPTLTADNLQQFYHSNRLHLPYSQALHLWHSIFREVYQVLHLHSSPCSASTHTQRWIFRS